MFAILYRGEKLIELREDHFWNVIENRILVTNSNDPEYSVEIDVPEGDVEGLVEVWIGIEPTA